MTMTIKFSPLLVLLMLCGCFEPQKPAPVTLYGGEAGAGSIGVHTVSKGETLYTISERYDVVMRDIVMKNHLAAPFALRTGQRITLPPPQTYRTKPGDTIYSISRLFGVSSTEVTRLNHWRAPYAVSAGQAVRLPSVIPVLSPLPDPLPIGERGQKIMETAHVLRLPPHYKAPGEGKNSSKKDSVVKLNSAQNHEKPSWEESDVPYQAPAVLASHDPVPAQTPKRESSRFLRPVGGKIISGYGAKAGGLHNDGVNIKAPQGTPVKAAENGVVVYAGNELKGTGNLVLLRHEGRWMTAYAHLDGIKVKRGDVIRRGQAIGTVGSTGSVDSPQLHFEVRRGTEAINPVRYLES